MESIVYLGLLKCLDTFILFLGVIGEGPTILRTDLKKHSRLIIIKNRFFYIVNILTLISLMLETVIILIIS